MNNFVGVEGERVDHHHGPVDQRFVEGNNLSKFKTTNTYPKYFLGYRKQVCSI